MSQIDDLQKKLAELDKQHADIGAYSAYGEVTKALMDEVKSLTSTVESLKSDLGYSDKDQSMNSEKLPKFQYRQTEFICDVNVNLLDYMKKELFVGDPLIPSIFDPAGGPYILGRAVEDHLRCPEQYKTDLVTVSYLKPDSNVWVLENPHSRNISGAGAISQKLEIYFEREKVLTFREVKSL